MQVWGSPCRCADTPVGPHNLGSAPGGGVGLWEGSTCGGFRVASCVSSWGVGWGQGLCRTPSLAAQESLLTSQTPNSQKTTLGRVVVGSGPSVCPSSMSACPCVCLCPSVCPYVHPSPSVRVHLCSSVLVSVCVHLSMGPCVLRACAPYPQGCVTEGDHTRWDSGWDLPLHHHAVSTAGIPRVGESAACVQMTWGLQAAG